MDWTIMTIGSADGAGAIGLFATTAAFATATGLQVESMVVPIGILVTGVTISFGVAWRASKRWTDMEHGIKRMEDRMERLMKDGCAHREEHWGGKGKNE